MSEMDELKKAALDSKNRAQVDAIGEYLDSLMAEIDDARKKEKYAWIMYSILWLVWVGTGFIHNGIVQEVGMVGFFFGLITTSITGMRVRSAYGEFLGAVRILEMLGMIPPSSGSRETKKKRFWTPGIDMVKSWFTKKEKAQKEAYAAA